MNILILYILSFLIGIILFKLLYNRECFNISIQNAQKEKKINISNKLSLQENNCNGNPKPPSPKLNYIPVLPVANCSPMYAGGSHEMLGRLNLEPPFLNWWFYSGYIKTSEGLEISISPNIISMSVIGFALINIAYKDKGIHYHYSTMNTKSIDDQNKSFKNTIVKVNVIQNQLILN